MRSLSSGMHYAASVSLTALLFAGSCLPANSETDASPTDPGFQTIASSVCDSDGNFYHCKNSACSKVGDFTADANGKVKFNFYGVNVEIGTQANAKITISSRFTATRLAIIPCAHRKKCKQTCQAHGYGCGNYNFFIGANCGFGIGSPSPVGWGSGCSAIQQ